MEYLLYKKKRKEEYLVNITPGRLVGHNVVFYEGIQVRDVAGVNLEVLETRWSCDYDLGCGMMPATTTGQVRVRKAGSATGADSGAFGIITGVANSYKKVTCYDDRLRVVIGEATVVGVGAK